MPFPPYVGNSFSSERFFVGLYLPLENLNISFPRIGFMFFGFLTGSPNISKNKLCVNSSYFSMSAFVFWRYASAASSRAAIFFCVGRGGRGILKEDIVVLDNSLKVAPFPRSFNKGVYFFNV